MTIRQRGIAVLAIQLVLVLSIAAKYAWERHTCPRVWTRTAQYDPSLPLRGRYLSLSLTADACSLPLGDATAQYRWENGHTTTTISSWRWTNVVPRASHGVLTATRPNGLRTEDEKGITLNANRPCTYGVLDGGTEFFISERFQLPTLKPGEELWAEVTVPPSGPPRPIHLAITNGRDFRLLDTR